MCSPSLYLFLKAYVCVSGEMFKPDVGVCVMDVLWLIAVTACLLNGGDGHDFSGSVLHLLQTSPPPPSTPITPSSLFQAPG